MQQELLADDENLNLRVQQGRCSWKCMGKYTSVVLTFFFFTSPLAVLIACIVGCWYRIDIALGEERAAFRCCGIALMTIWTFILVGAIYWLWRGQGTRQFFSPLTHGLFIWQPNSRVLQIKDALRDEVNDYQPVTPIVQTNINAHIENYNFDVYELFQKIPIASNYILHYLIGLFLVNFLFLSLAYAWDYHNFGLKGITTQWKDVGGKTVIIPSCSDWWLENMGSLIQILPLSLIMLSVIIQNMFYLACKLYLIGKLPDLDMENKKSTVIMNFIFRRFAASEGKMLNTMFGWIIAWYFVKFLVSAVEVTFLQPKCLTLDDVPTKDFQVYIDCYCGNSINHFYAFHGPMLLFQLILIFCGFRLEYALVVQLEHQVKKVQALKLDLKFRKLQGQVAVNNIPIETHYKEIEIIEDILMMIERQSDSNSLTHNIVELLVAASVFLVPFLEAELLQEHGETRGPLILILLIGYGVFLLIMKFYRHKQH